MKKILFALFIFISFQSFAQITGYSGLTMRLRDSSMLFTGQHYSGGSPVFNSIDYYRLRPMYKQEMALNSDTTGFKLQVFNPNTNKIQYVAIQSIGAGIAVDTIYRTLGKDSIQFTIAGRYHAIKDSVGSGGGTPGGSTKQIQYNNAGAFGGATGFEYGNTNNSVKIASQATTDKPFIVQAITSQSANLSEWRNSNNIARTYIDSGGRLVFNGYSATVNGYESKLYSNGSGANANIKMDFYTGYDMQFFANSTNAIITTNSPLLTFSLPVTIGNSTGGQPFKVTGSSGLSWLEVDFYGGTTVNKDNAANGDFISEGQTDANLFVVDASADKVGIGTASPSSKLTISGSLGLGYVSKAVDYTATSSDCVIELTATGKTITLPTAASITGRVYTIKLTASGSGTIATTSSQTIDGSTTYSLSAQYKYITVVSNGTNWIITANN